MKAFEQPGQLYFVTMSLHAPLKDLTEFESDAITEVLKKMRTELCRVRNAGGFKGGCCVEEFVPGFVENGRARALYYPHIHGVFLCDEGVDLCTVFNHFSIFDVRCTPLRTAHEVKNRLDYLLKVTPWGAIYRRDYKRFNPGNEPDRARIFNEVVGEVIFLFEKANYGRGRRSTFGSFRYKGEGYFSPPLSVLMSKAYRHKVLRWLESFRKSDVDHIEE